jgi:NitT/TauT family transport system permease protein
VDGVSPPAPALAATPEGARGGETVRVRLLQAASVLVVLGAWEAAARLRWVDPLFVAPPSAVAGALAQIGGTALAALGDTLGKTLVAYAIAVGLGVPGGLLVGSVRTVHDVVHPFVVALYGIPKILILPWIVLLLGFGTAPAVAYGAIHGLFPILIMVIGGVRDVDAGLVTVARAYGARRWQVFWKVILPASVPSVLAGLRLGIVFCLLGTLVVEMFAGVRGMGYVMSAYANGFQAAQLFAATALVSLASIAIVLGLDHLNERLSHWRG